MIITQPQVSTAHKQTNNILTLLAFLSCICLQGWVGGWEVFALGGMVPCVQGEVWGVCLGWGLRCAQGGIRSVFLSSCVFIHLICSLPYKLTQVNYSNHYQYLGLDQSGWSELVQQIETNNLRWINEKSDDWYLMKADCWFLSDFRLPTWKHRWWWPGRGGDEPTHGGPQNTGSAAPAQAGRHQRCQRKFGLAATATVCV